MWLDKSKTSVYKFYQFWLNASDEDSKKYIYIFTLYSRDQIVELIAKHEESPHLRLLQKSIADEITKRVHSNENLKSLKRHQIFFLATLQKRI